MDTVQTRIKQNNTGQADFHGASIIDQQGKEIPITEEMLQSAFNTLIYAWEHQQHAQK